jgi:hypothetical protein
VTAIYFLLRFFAIAPYAGVAQPVVTSARLIRTTDTRTPRLRAHSPKIRSPRLLVGRNLNMILVADLLACIDVDEHRHRSLSGFLLPSEDPGAQGILAQSRHTAVKVLPRSVKRTTKQIATGTTKRRAVRTKAGHLSERAPARLSE